MKWSSEGALLVAGIDRSEESLAAARYAAAAAEMRGCDILLVHAFPAPPTNAPEMDAVWSASRTSAEELVASAAAQLAVSPRVHVHTLAEPGDPMAVLEDAARQGEMLVLGRDHVSWGERVSQGRVTSHVARRVHLSGGRCSSWLANRPCRKAPAGSGRSGRGDERGIRAESGVSRGSAARHSAGRFARRAHRHISS